ncbi:natural killer cell receptor 2B4-like isoform X2 [Siphateles boraxobius]
MEGDSVTLNTDVTEIQSDEQILWMFGPQEIRIAEIYKRDIDMFDSNVTFGDRLQMDNQTGSLTIRNISTEHTGLYKLQIISSRGTLYKRFNVTVYAPLPVPVITSYSSQCSSSERSSGQNCSLVCSVLNVSDVTLSWYKGISVLSSISVCDLSISLSLPLEVEYQDKNTYSCVINNPISNQTQYLNMDLCKECPNYSAVVYFICSALLGLGSYALYWKNKRTAQQGNQLCGFELCANTVEEAQTVVEMLKQAEPDSKKRMLNEKSSLSSDK